ncbi:tyrosine-type recombinase/integrase [Desulfocicer niacini]
MPLTDTAIRNVKPQKKQHKISDANGMYLLVNKTGKYFRMDYRFQGKRKTIAFGVYPNITLKQARQRCIDARSLLDQGIDPMQYKKEAKLNLEDGLTNSFQNVGMEWYLKNKQAWKPGHARTILSRLENNIFPWLGKKPIKDITAPELLTALRRVEDRGAIETAHRIKQICGQVFRYAIATGRTDRDPSADLKGALAPTVSSNMSAITSPEKVGDLLRAIDGYTGQFVTRCALKLAPLVFVRPGELRHAEWSEINFDASEWKIPAHKMKKNRTHLIPLSSQAIQILEEIQPLTGDLKYVFPSVRSTGRPMSENTVLAALRRMGFTKEEMTGHGFRAMASTLLHENGFPSHLIENQLAHVEGNSVKAAYNHAEYIKERGEMMQWWANYLDKLRGNINA